MASRSIVEQTRSRSSTPKRKRSGPPENASQRDAQSTSGQPEKSEEDHSDAASQYEDDDADKDPGSSDDDKPLSKKPKFDSDTKARGESSKKKGGKSTRKSPKAKVDEWQKLQQQLARLDDNIPPGGTRSAPMWKRRENPEILDIPAGSPLYNLRRGLQHARLWERRDPEIPAAKRAEIAEGIDAAREDPKNSSSGKLKWRVIKDTFNQVLPNIIRGAARLPRMSSKGPEQNIRNHPYQDFHLTAEEWETMTQQDYKVMLSGDGKGIYFDGGPNMIAGFRYYAYRTARPDYPNEDWSDIAPSGKQTKSRGTKRAARGQGTKQKAARKRSPVPRPTTGMKGPAGSHSKSTIGNMRPENRRRKVNEHNTTQLEYKVVRPSERPPRHPDDPYSTDDDENLPDYEHEEEDFTHAGEEAADDDSTTPFYAPRRFNPADDFLDRNNYPHHTTGSNFFGDEDVKFSIRSAARHMAESKSDHSTSTETSPPNRRTMSTNDPPSVKERKCTMLLGSANDGRHNDQIYECGGYIDAEGERRFCLAGHLVCEYCMRSAWEEMKSSKIDYKIVYSGSLMPLCKECSDAEEERWRETDTEAEAHKPCHCWQPVFNAWRMCSECLAAELRSRKAMLEQAIVRTESSNATSPEELALGKITPRLCLRCCLRADSGMRKDSTEKRIANEQDLVRMCCSCFKKVRTVDRFDAGQVSQYAVIDPLKDIIEDDGKLKQEIDRRMYGAQIPPPGWSCNTQMPELNNEGFKTLFQPVLEQPSFVYESETSDDEDGGEGSSRASRRGLNPRNDDTAAMPMDVDGEDSGDDPESEESEAE